MPTGSGPTPECEPEPVEAVVDDGGPIAAEREWWDDPRMPWRGKPTRADLACWVVIAAIGVYSLVLLPLRPHILRLSPYALVAFNGSTTGLVAIGANVATVGDHWWPSGLLAASLSIMKFDWVYWWAGRLWGQGMIDVLTARSAWARRTATRAIELARRVGPLAVLLTYLPFIPAAVIYVAVGAARMRLWLFLLMDFVGALLSRGL